MTDPKLEPTEMEYHISAIVKFVDVDVQDGDRRYKSKLVLLIPEDSTQQMLFFNAWLPEVSEEFFELTAIIKTGVQSFARLAILRRKQGICDRPYLMIMSKGVAEDFIHYRMEGRRIELVIQPESCDELADKAKDSSGDFDLIHGQSEMSL